MLRNNPLYRLGLMNRLVLFLVALGAAFFITFIAADVVFAAEGVVDEIDNVPPTGNELLLSTDQLWVTLLGSVVPLIGYVLNTHAPWISEPVKALVQVVLAALVGALFEIVEAGEFVVNAQTFQLVGTAIVSALVTHRFLWLPSGISVALGGGQNRNLDTRR